MVLGTAGPAVAQVGGVPALRAPIAEPPPSTTVLARGDSGDDVLAVQRRLNELGYWVGPHDGVFGVLTEQAVFAFQKVNELAVDGIVGPETYAALDAGRRRIPRTGISDGIVVDRQSQVVLALRDGKVAWVFNTSTGTERPYTFNGQVELADTPPGHWQVYRRFDGVEVALLGSLYRPIYFHSDGIAVHGSPHVPSYPASHGCVRLTDAAMDAIWAGGFAPVGADVWVL